MLTIEFEPPKTFKCECCGNDTTRLTRFVYKDGDAHAVYYAQFAKGHPDNSISGIVSLGTWGDSAAPSDRLAFPFELWVRDDKYHVSLVDAAESPWRDSTFIGRLLNRDEAIAHPWRKEVFHLTDHMVVEDQQIVDFLSASETGG